MKPFRPFDHRSPGSARGGFALTVVARSIIAAFPKRTSFPEVHVNNAPYG